MSLIPFERSFASHEKSQYWSKKNGDLTPDQVFISTNKKYWFDCYICGHSFESVIGGIKKGAWCPYCSIPIKTLCHDTNCNICFNNSFASHERSRYWSSINGDIKPRQVTKSSAPKRWFDCNVCGHSFDISLYSVTQGNWCSYCSPTSNKLCDSSNCTVCFERSFASIEKSQYWSKRNGDVTPRDVTKSSTTQKRWFDCHKCNHTFEMYLSQVTSGAWCPFCAVPPKALCDDTSCTSCLEKSLKSQDQSRYWSKRNKTITPRQVFKSTSLVKYWFDCPTCNHSFEKFPSQVTNGSWCPYCAVPPKALCDDVSCNACFEKSFASSEKSQYWSQRNESITPRQVFMSSNTKYWFDCPKCNHLFKAVPNHLASKGSWCPYCAVPSRQLCNDISCTFCFERSFASHEKSKYWSTRNGHITPRKIFKLSSMVDYWFDCDLCNKPFQISITSITNGCWCSCCTKKSEKKLYQALLPIYPSIITQFKVDWCKNQRHLPFDFCIPDHRIIIELDGPQHFKQIMNWQSPEQTSQIDKYKEQCANENNYSVIRIIQEDVWFDKYDWLSDLCKAIEEIKHGDSVVNIYLCKNNEYEHF